MKHILPILILLCLSAFGADGTYVYKYIEEDGGGDYTTLEDWEAGRQTNCVTASSVEIAVIQGSWDNADADGDFGISGWTTGANNYIVITNSTSKHSGKWTTTAYRLEATPASGSGAIGITEEYVRIYGLQVKVTSTANTSVAGIRFQGVGTAVGRVAYCIVVGVLSGSGYGYGIYNFDSDCTLYAWNNIVYDFVNSTTTSRGLLNEGGISYFYNNTAHNCYVGIRNASGTGYAINNISQDCPSLCYSGSWTSSSYNNGDDGTAPDTNESNGEVTFADEANDDFHLGAADSYAINLGTADPGSGLFSDDIDYVTRTGSWDIGADEYVAAGTSTKQVILIRTR